VRGPRKLLDAPFFPSAIFLTASDVDMPVRQFHNQGGFPDLSFLLSTTVTPPKSSAQFNGRVFPLIRPSGRSLWPALCLLRPAVREIKICVHIVCGEAVREWPGFLDAAGFAGARSVSGMLGRDGRSAQKRSGVSVLR
jgi:hypothetical protein